MSSTKGAYTSGRKSIVTLSSSMLHVASTASLESRSGLQSFGSSLSTTMTYAPTRARPTNALSKISSLGTSDSLWSILSSIREGGSRSAALSSVPTESASIQSMVLPAVSAIRMSSRSWLGTSIASWGPSSINVVPSGSGSRSPPIPTKSHAPAGSQALTILGSSESQQAVKTTPGPLVIASPAPTSIACVTVWVTLIGTSGAASPFSSFQHASLTTVSDASSSSTKSASLQSEVPDCFDNPKSMPPPLRRSSSELTITVVLAKHQCSTEQCGQMCLDHGACRSITHDGSTCILLAIEIDFMPDPSESASGELLCWNRCHEGHNRRHLVDPVLKHWTAKVPRPSHLGPITTALEHAKATYTNRIGTADSNLISRDTTNLEPIKTALHHVHGSADRNVHPIATASSGDRPSKASGSALRSTSPVICDLFSKGIGPRHLHAGCESSIAVSESESPTDQPAMSIHTSQATVYQSIPTMQASEYMTSVVTPGVPKICTIFSTIYVM